ncbi:hypothetical protein [Treponema sp. OMZ 840]
MIFSIKTVNALYRKKGKTSRVWIRDTVLPNMLGGVLTEIQSV